MFRLRWCGLPLPVPVLLFILGLSSFWISEIFAECWYSNQNHEEGTEVQTAEPCLNCTCSRGALLCYLRVCPKLPNPPPPGCILLHRYQTCCPELICTELFGGDNGLEARSEPEEIDLPTDTTLAEHACVANGTVYGSGSAMDSSSLCEYCYCLRGKQICVKPKCLLPISGCQPVYQTNNCCPSYYNCTHFVETTSSTTTAPVTEIQQKGGCKVDGVYYSEGGKVLGVGHSACDNCYCLRNLLRCEPLSCAPPLLGCSPIIRPGECCAASYNCSGAIEIDPEPNYGDLIVSKEYAKLRKQVQVSTEKTTFPLYVIAESLPSTTKVQRSPLGTTRHFTSISFKPSTPKPFLEKIKNLGAGYAQNKLPSLGIKKSYSTTEVTTLSLDYIEANDNTFFSIVDSLLNDRSNKETESNTEELKTSTDNDQTTISTTFETTTEEISTIPDETTTNSKVVTLQTILNSTDCIDSSNFIQDTTITSIDAQEINKLVDIEANKKSPIETTTDFIEAEPKNKVRITGSNKNPLEIEAIPNISKYKDEDYDYDYNEPSLPPSLPNLRIIPFVAADALDSDKENQELRHPQKHVTPTASTYTNLFSPPAETEGGFVPKEPSILESFYENAVTPSVITNTPKGHKVSCISEGREIPHGETIPAESPCIICSCFYGNTICQKVTCPLPKPGCRQGGVLDINSCCPRYVCDVGSSTTTNPDPFHNVIRTEPAPSLQSLIVDMIPYLAGKTTPMPLAEKTTMKSLTEQPTKSNNTSNESNFSLDSVLEMLFPSTQTQTAEIKNSSNTATPAKGKQEASTESFTGVLKLAGCNIYGRMYRVGRIISELSNPA